MSLVPEDIVAVHAGLKVLAFSVVTDLCFPDSLEPADIRKILKTAAEAEPKLTRLVMGVLGRLEGGAGR
jgi:purine-nucleoside phosphorylase